MIHLDQINFCRQTTVEPDQNKAKIRIFTSFTLSANGQAWGKNQELYDNIHGSWQSWYITQDSELFNHVIWCVDVAPSINIDVYSSARLFKQENANNVS